MDSSQNILSTKNSAKKIGNYDASTPQFLPPKLERRGSVGASAFAGLSLNAAADDQKQMRRRLVSFAKHKRVSVCASILNPLGTHDLRRATACFGASRLEVAYEETSAGSLHNRSSLFPTTKDITERPHNANDPRGEVLATDTILMAIFKFSEERELIHNVSTVSKLWAQVATKTHANLMLTSVGCTPYFGACAKACFSNGEVELEESPSANASQILRNQRDWSFLVTRFPWACFLGDGAFKRVYKVWNSSMECYEALSLM